MQSLINHLITQQKIATPAQLARIGEYVAAVPFAADPLEVDEALWGSFWQFDVIGPGYTLPAGELALLRAVRLDRAWPEETSLAQFLIDLRRAISDPQAGIWSLTVNQEPCLVFVGAPNRSLVTVVWYCASTGRLHAGYRAGIMTWSPSAQPFRKGFRGGQVIKRLGPTATLPPPNLPLLEGGAKTTPSTGGKEEVLSAIALQQRAPNFLEPPEKSEPVTPEWLIEAVEQTERSRPATPAARLDAEILRLRVEMSRNKV